MKLGWCDEFNNAFVILFPGCVLKFDWHKCYAYKPGIVKSNYFIVAARCKNRGCTNFKFICEFPIHKPFSDVK